MLLGSVVSYGVTAARRVRGTHPRQAHAAPTAAGMTVVPAGTSLVCRSTRIDKDESNLGDRVDLFLRSGHSYYGVSSSWPNHEEETP